MSIVVRPSRRGEEEALADVATRAFQTGDPQHFLRYYHEHTMRGPADTVVAEVDGEIAGHVTGLHMNMRFRGVDLPFRGLSAVAVAPEFRQRGLAERMLKAHLGRLRSKGEPLSLLYPFTVPFYAKHGWGVIEWVETLRVPPRSLPASPLRERVRRLELSRDAATLRTIYEAARLRSDGFIGRDDFWWDMRVLPRAPERVLYTDPERGPEGYLLYDVPKEPAYPFQQLHVRELAAVTPAAFQGLIGFLASLGDQFPIVELFLPRGTAASLVRYPADRTVDTYDLYIPTAMLSSGAMAQLVDLPGAFALHPDVKASGRIGLDVAGVPYDVTFSTRGARAEKGDRHRDRLALAPDRLASVYFGAASAALLVQQGHAQGSARAAALLDQAFAGPPLFISRLNMF